MEQSSLSKLKAPMMAAADPDELLCRQIDPELWYSETTNDIVIAKLICSHCPVVADCLNWAIATNEQWGVWGGATTDERKQIKRQRLSSEHEKASA